MSLEEYQTWCESQREPPGIWVFRYGTWPYVVLLTMMGSRTLVQHTPTKWAKVRAFIRWCVDSPWTAYNFRVHSRGYLAEWSPAEMARRMRYAPWART